MRAQLIELTAARECFSLNALSEKRVLTMSYIVNGVAKPVVSGCVISKIRCAHLAVVECTCDLDIVYICIHNCGHLRLLNFGHTTAGE